MQVVAIMSGQGRWFWSVVPLTTAVISWHPVCTQSLKTSQTVCDVLQGRGSRCLWHSGSPGLVPAAAQNRASLSVGPRSWIHWKSSLHLISTVLLPLLTF